MYYLRTSFFFISNHIYCQYKQNLRKPFLIVFLTCIRIPLQQTYVSNDGKIPEVVKDDLHSQGECVVDKPRNDCLRMGYLPNKLDCPPLQSGFHVFLERTQRANRMFDKNFIKRFLIAKTCFPVSSCSLLLEHLCITLYT